MAGTTAGGTVAAPVFRRVAGLTLRYLGVRPRGTKSMKLSEVAEYAKGEDLAELAYAAAKAAKGAPERLLTEPDDPGAAVAWKGTTAVPEVLGMPMRVAVQGVLEAGLIPLVEGTGRLSRTEPPVGTKVSKGSKLILVFEPQT
jgi:cell division protein FtsI (penicillin-binding protein 3)